MRKEGGGTRADVRSSALWGSGSRGGDSRSNALWGKSGRGIAALAALVAMLVVPATGGAVIGDCGSGLVAMVPKSLAKEACADRSKVFNVIVQGRIGKSSDLVATTVALNGGQNKRKFRSVIGTSARMTGGQLLGIARNPHILAITRDARVRPTDYQNSEMWRDSVNIGLLQHSFDPASGEVTGPAPQAPAIAIVDSGVDASRKDVFGDRVVASVNLSSLTPDAVGDGQGHGTMVAALAAGASAEYPGVAPNAPIVSIRTSDGNGMSITSDVIAAADWILANKDQYNIRVANFSLKGSAETSFRFDPLDKAVERLWFNGVVVVAAAGNHGSADGPVNMSYAPGNDPFIITVGAVDENGTPDPLDNTRAPWSAYGHTMDGFYKPEVSAPGRYLVMPEVPGSAISQNFAARSLGNGYLWMSGTSFSAPVVSGIAAQLLARHPEWSPDQVKGALMRNSNFLAGADFSAGVGQIDGLYSSLDELPPNPNENLYAFVESDPLSGQKAFNEASWTAHVASNASWTAASWTSASWTKASWTAASWTSASWTAASWTQDVSSAMSSEVSENEASWTNSSWTASIGKE